MTGLNHPAAIGAGIEHAPAPVRREIADQIANRNTVATVRPREPMTRRVFRRLVKTALARVRVMRVMQSNDRLANLGAHQLRDIGLDSFVAVRSHARSIAYLVLYEGVVAPRDAKCCETVSSNRAAAPLRTPRNALRTLSRWRERVRQRRLLGSLDDRALHDICLSRCDVESEVRKPFWRP